LSAKDGPLYGNGFSVTGYSLGGHLATAFNLLHPGAATQVITFNGAGVGLTNGNAAVPAKELAMFAAMSKADGSGEALIEQRLGGAFFVET
jgi:pimeloyl-ACP methyl ester carboxylesterase